MRYRTWTTHLFDISSRAAAFGGLAALALAATACDPATISTAPTDAADAADPPVDAPPGVDAPGPDAPQGPPAHLLLTEVTLTPDQGEFVEIYNPGNQSVDLSDYYLSDDADYALLPGAFGDGPAPNVDGVYDFIVRFPDGATIGAGQAKVVAIHHTDFNTHYGQGADYGLTQAGGAQAMRDPGSFIGTTPQLTNAGEAIVLFYWDGTSDLVMDVDMVHAGQPSAGNQVASKTSVMVDGPDADTTATTYKADAATLGLMNNAADTGYSHKRIAPEGAYETRADQGNGVTGDDETSEDIAQTWDSTFSVPTPGNVPAAL